MKRLLIAISILCGMSACSATPTAVDLTIDATSIDAGALQTITQMMVHTDGDNYSKLIDVHSVINSRFVRVRYLPGLKSGTLTFTVDAEAADSTVVASCATQSVTVATNKIVAADCILGPGRADMSVVGDAGDGGTNGDGGRLPGQCTDSSQCTTAGGCVDGYCCDTACNDSCHACNLPGLTGKCSPVPAGQAPAAGHATCGPDPVSSCMRDGTCDGKGSCRLYVGGTACGAATCDSTSNMFTASSTCDGKGVCQSGSSITCAPYTCQTNSACFTNCTGTNTGCAAGNVCNSGSCGLKGVGASCNSGSECQSTYCSDGVCCKTACGQSCYSCNQATALGTCTPVPANTDPRNNCPAGTGPNAYCSPGKCDGAGACNVATSSTVCQAAQCVNGEQTGTANCNSTGTCQIPTAVACSPYACGTTTCANPCTATTGCAPNYACVGGSCIDCQPASSSSPAYVDPANGTDDSLHGGSTGQCAYRTIGYALAHASGTINLAPASYSGETYPLTLSGSQTLKGESGGSVSLSTSGDVVHIAGPNAGVFNCNISCGSAGNGVTVSSGLSTGTITISGCSIDSCGFGILGNGSSTLVITGNQITHATNGINNLGNSNITNNYINCTGGSGKSGDAINICVSGDAVNGSGNQCFNCSLNCNSCNATPNCFASGFWSTSC